MSSPYTYPAYCHECGNVADADICPMHDVSGELVCSQECMQEANMRLVPETESQIEAVMFVSRENDEQARFLEHEGALQEEREKMFCLGMLVGGAIALVVLMVTLKVLGVV